MSGEVSVLRAVTSSSSPSPQVSLIEKSGSSDSVTLPLVVAPSETIPLHPEISLTNVSLSAAVVDASFSWIDQDALSAEIQRSQSAIKQIDTEIAAKKTIISKIDEAAAVALNNLVTNQSYRIQDPISSDVCPFRVEWARRRSGANRSRGGKPRTINPSYADMDMNQETNKNLPS